MTSQPNGSPASLPSRPWAGQSRSRRLGRRRLRGLPDLGLAGDGHRLPARRRGLRRLGRPARRSGPRPRSTAGCSAATWPYLGTRRRARAPSPGRRPSLRRYFGWLRRARPGRGRPDGRPLGAEGRGPPAAGAARRRAPPAARRAAGGEPATIRRRPRRATTPSSSCSTAAACGSASCAACASGDVDLAGGVGHRLGQGRQAAPGARSAAPAVDGASAGGSTGGRDALADAGAPPADAAVPQPARAAAHAPGRPADRSTAGRRRPRTPTPSGTPSPPTCSTAVPTCGPCRSCSATPTWRRPSSTLTSAGAAARASSTPPIRGPDRTGEERRGPTTPSDVERLWADYKAAGAPRRARPADPPLLAAGQVRRRPGRRRPARRTSSRPTSSATASSG